MAEEKGEKGEGILPAKPSNGGIGGKLVAALVVGLIIGLLVGGITLGSILFPQEEDAPTKTFVVIPHHWGFALYDDQGNELEKIEVNRGDEVKLIFMNGDSLTHDIHEEFDDRTLEAWENNSAFGGKNHSELHELVEEAMDTGLTSHGVAIEGYLDDVNVLLEGGATDASKIHKIVTFTPDTVGSFDIFCAESCGWGHQYMRLTDGFVVT